MKTLRTKRPDDRLDYDVDFSRWLTTGDEIESVTVEINDGATMQIDDHDFTPSAVKVWLSGGADGETATITVEATTAQDRVKEICFKIRVREGC